MALLAITSTALPEPPPGTAVYGIPIRFIQLGLVAFGVLVAFCGLLLNWYRKPHKPPPPPPLPRQPNVPFYQRGQ